MLKNILLACVAVIVLLVVAISMKPNEFRVTRSATLNASPAAVFSHVNDFHQWEAWSPWAKLDPTAKISYEGAPSGVGAIFRWAGNDQVGEGSNTIVESKPNELIRIKLEFIKPFAGVSTADFSFEGEGGQTTVTWSMYGKNNFIGKAMSLFMNCDKMVGGQFEEGLANLKRVVEGPVIP